MSSWAIRWFFVLGVALFAAACSGDDDGEPGERGDGGAEDGGAEDGGLQDGGMCLEFGPAPAPTCEPPSPDQLDPDVCSEFCPQPHYYGDYPSGGARAEIPALSPAADRALVASYYSGLIDVSDPRAPERVGWPDAIAEHLWGGSIEGELAAVLVYPPIPATPHFTTLELATVSLAGDGPSELIGSLELPGNSARLERRGELALVFSTDDEAHMAWLTSVRIASDAAPEQIAQLEWSYASDLGSMQFGRVMASFAEGRVYIARPNTVTVRSATQLLAVDVAADGELSTPLEAITVDGLVLSNDHIAESGGVLRVLTTANAGETSVPAAQLSRFSRDDLELIDALPLPLEADDRLVEASIRDGVATAVVSGQGSVRALIVKPATPPGELYATLDLGETSATLVVAGDRLVVHHPLLDDGPTEIALYDLSGETIAPIDTAVLESTSAGDFRYSEELALGLFTRSDSSLDLCGWKADLELVRIADDGIESLGALRVFGDSQVASAGGRLLVDDGGRFAAVSPAAVDEAPWINTRFTPAQLVIADGKVVRVGMVGWSLGPWLDVVAQEDAAAPPVNGVALLPSDGARSCARQITHVHRDGDYVFVLVDDYGRESTEDEWFYVLFVIDVSDEAAPRVVSDTVLPNVHLPRPNGEGFFPINGEFMGATSDALIFVYRQSADGEDDITVQWLDLSDPTQPELRELAEDEAFEDSALGARWVSGDLVALTRIDQDSGKRLLERIDLGDPAEARRLPAFELELEADLVAYDAQAEHALLRREPHASCSYEGSDLALADLGEASSCVIDVALKQSGNPQANERAFVARSYEEDRLRLGAWDGDAIASREIDVPHNVYESELVLAGWHVVAQSTPNLIYDARCPEAEPTEVDKAVFADDAAAGERVILVREGDALVPAPLPSCDP